MPRKAQKTETKRKKKDPQEEEEEEEKEEKKEKKEKKGESKEEEEEEEEEEKKEKGKRKRGKAKKEESPEPEEPKSAPETVDFSQPSKTDGQLKIISWNVAGLKAAIKKGFNEYVKNEQPDIMCLQETKSDGKEITDRLGYQWHFYASAEKKGYSGTAILTKEKPIKITYGMGIPKHDGQGRLITMEFEKFFLINTYVPNSGQGLPRLGYRMEWEDDFLKYVKGLEAQKPVVWCGDLNVAHQPIDLANPGSNAKTAGFTKEEREKFTTFLKSGFVDTWRHFNPTQTGCYTFWSFKKDSRAKNVGWRLDYFVVSQSLLPQVSHSFMRTNVMGSDHCPIGVILNK